MRILFVTNNYTPYAGGVVKSIQATVDALHHQGHEVFIVTLDFLGSLHDDPSYVFRIPSLIRFTYKQNYMAIAWRPRHYLEWYIKQLSPDVIHVHHPFLLGFLAAQLAKKHKIPVVLTYHTLYEQYAHYVPVPSGFAAWMIRIVVARFCKQVDGIIVHSQAVFACVVYGYAPLMILPSGVSAPFLSIPFQRKTISAHPVRLLVVSRLVPEKNITWLLDLIALMPEVPVTLTIVGFGMLYDELRDYAYTTLQLGSRVCFVYKPSLDALLEQYRSAHLFLFSSTSDTQALVLAEAMASGTPVIALDGPGQRDIIEDGYDGFMMHDK